MKKKEEESKTRAKAKAEASDEDEDEDEESTTSGYAVGDVAGNTAVQVKTERVSAALDEMGMGRYQWCMCVVLCLHLPPSLPSSLGFSLDES